MPKRSSLKNRNEINRTQRKSRWIRVKNHMRLYPECAYGGDFYCNHVYDPQYPWVWVDFRFFHTKLKKYFAVAMTTMEYSEWNKDSVAAMLQAEKEIPINLNQLSNKEDFNEWLRRIPTKEELAHQELEKKITAELNNKPRIVKPEIIVKDYGPVAVEVWANVNKPFIDEHVIREFIEHYRSLGEPITPGYTWYGDETEILPQRLNDRYPESIE